MSSYGCCHMMCRSCLAPSIAEFSRSYRETRSHVGISKCKNRSLFVHAFRNNKFEITIPILCDSKIGYISNRRIELCQITTARLTMKYIYDFHRWLSRLRDIRISGTRMTDNANIIVEIDGIHLR